MVTEPSADYPYFTSKSIEWLENHAPFDRVFEWGVGGSTVWLARHAGLLLSIEHKYKWVHTVERALSYRSITTATVKLASLERDYLGHVEADIPWDLVVIDGRRRVDCVKAAMPYVAEGGYMLLDNSERKRYREATNLLDDRWDLVFSHNNGVWETSIWRNDDPIRSEH